MQRKQIISDVGKSICGFYCLSVHLCPPANSFLLTDKDDFTFMPVKKPHTLILCPQQESISLHFKKQGANQHISE